MSGGGVLIAVWKNISLVHQPQFESDAEDVLITIFYHHHGWKMHICCVYLPPRHDLARTCFSTKLQSNFDHLTGEATLIYGDFNFPHITCYPSECG